MQRRMRGGFTRFIGAAMLSATIAACPPMAETIARAQSAPATEQPQARQQAQQGAQSRSYNAATNPFELNDALMELAGKEGTAREKVDALFAALRKGGTSGVRVVDGEGRPPRTAIETLEQGGDCTELATLAIAVLQRMGLEGGALVVHFNNAPAEVDHMIPYVMLDGERTIMDLQADRLGRTGSGAYSEVMQMSYPQAASMHHREWGDYFIHSGRAADAIRAYERALELCEPDAYVHHNLAIAYEQTGNMQAAARHHRRAAELAPDKYGQEQARGTYNEELQQCQEDGEAGRWQGCATHCQNALDSGERLSAEERQAIEEFRDTCRHNAEVTGQ